MSDYVHIVRAGGPPSVRLDRVPANQWFYIGRSLYCFPSAFSPNLPQKMVGDLLLVFSIESRDLVHYPRGTAVVPVDITITVREGGRPNE